MVSIPSWTLTTTIIDFPMMSSPPPPPLPPLPPPHLASLKPPSWMQTFANWLGRELKALLAEMGLDEEEPLPLSLTR
jgi:hypothetical protein